VGCTICTNLERAFEKRRSEYMTTCTEVYRRVSSKRMAYAAVEVERARSDLAVHRAVCGPAAAKAGARRS